MKLSSFAEVQRLAKVRDQILEDLAAMDIGLFNITIRGQGQDDAMAARVMPVMKAELTARLAATDRELAARSVNVDC